MPTRSGNLPANKYPPGRSQVTEDMSLTYRYYIPHWENNVIINTFDQVDRNVNYLKKILFYSYNEPDL